MAISVDEIDYWRSLPTETAGLEFKEAKKQYDSEKLFGYCVAIANEGGGHLLLGIRNSLPRIVVGSQAIDNPVGMTEKILKSLDSVSISRQSLIETEESWYLRFRVAQGERPGTWRVRT